MIAVPERYAIAFKMPNGFQSQGPFALTYEEANAWIVYLQKEYPEIHHWIVQEPPKDTV